MKKTHAIFGSLLIMLALAAIAQDKPPLTLFLCLK
jgi:hypothetical protein